MLELAPEASTATFFLGGEICGGLFGGQVLVEDEPDDAVLLRRRLAMVFQLRLCDKLLVWFWIG